MNTPPSKQKLTILLQKAVAARVAYWDASTALEVALGYPGDDIPDRVSDAIFDGIATLAVDCDSPESAARQIEEEHLDWLMNEIAKEE